MTQSEIDRAVATATGETVHTVSVLGFTIADPEIVEYDPDPCDIEDLIVDWDELDAQYNMPLVPSSA